MPMVSFFYVSAPAPASEIALDTATAGHLLALALDQFQLEPRRRLYMVSRLVFLPLLCLHCLSCLTFATRARERVMRHITREWRVRCPGIADSSLPHLATRRGQVRGGEQGGRRRRDDLERLSGACRGAERGLGCFWAVFAG